MQTGAYSVSQTFSFIFSDKTSYDKSSLAQKWQELSSKENMELADDDEYYNYYDFDERQTRRPSLASHFRINMCVVSLCCVLGLVSMLL